MNSNDNLRALPVGERISDYKIEGVLGQGGFGITYLATDVMLNKRVAVKEYYPREFAVRESTRVVRPTGSQEDRDTFKWGLDRFLEEARILARFDEPNIIAVRRFFSENGTAYLVMDYCDGEPLDEVVKRKGSLSEAEIQGIFLPLLNGLERIHHANFLHRDIKPANIFIKKDGSPVLLDFGAARQEIHGHSRSVTSLATPGYAAFEQYSTHGKQGPWTDIYGLSATLYRAISGKKPQDAPDRILDDTLVPLSKLCASGYSPKLLNAIDKGMSVRPVDRPQSISDWKMQLGLNSAGIVNAPLPKEQVNNSVESTEFIVPRRNPNLKDSKDNLSNPAGGRKKLFITIFVVIAVLVLIVFSGKKSPTNEDTVAINKVEIPASQISSELRLYQSIAGSWTLSGSSCDKWRLSYLMSPPDLGVEEIMYEPGKLITKNVRSVTKVGESVVRILSASSDGSKSESDYQLVSDNSIRLVRMVSISKNNEKKAIALNGKWLDDVSATPTYTRCN